FHEAEERLNKYLLGGQPLRHPKTGGDNGVRLLDVNHDRYLDVVISQEELHQTRVWSPKTRSWQAGDFPRFLSGMGVRSGAVRFGIVRSDGSASFLFRNEQEAGAWSFDGGRWVEDKELLNGLTVHGKPLLTGMASGADLGARLRDLDGDGRCELIARESVFTWSPQKKTWEQLPFTLPPGA